MKTLMKATVLAVAAVSAQVSYAEDAPQLQVQATAQVQAQAAILAPHAKVVVAKAAQLPAAEVIDNPDIVTGHFKGYFPVYDLTASIFIGESPQSDGTKSYYGVIISENDIGKYFGSVYHIVPREKGMQAWIQLFRDETGMVTSDPQQRATWDVSTVYSGRSRRSAGLQFFSTDFGKEIGCVDAPEQVKLKRFRKWRLSDFPKNHFAGEKDREKGDFSYNNGNIAGRITWPKYENEFHQKFSAKPISGNFTIEPILGSGSVGKLIKLATDPETIDGMAYASELEGVIVSMQPSRLLRRDKFHFAVFDLHPIELIGKNKICASRVTIVEED